MIGIIWEEAETVLVRKLLMRTFVGCEHFDKLRRHVGRSEKSGPETGEIGVMAET